MAFNHPFHNIKPSVPLKNVDRERLLSRIKARYPDAQLDAIVPGNIQIARFTTPSREQGTVYVSGGDVLWFRLGWAGDHVEILPTVRTLAKAPNLLPVLHTTDAVRPTMIGGSHLMIQDVSGSRQVLGRLNTGTIVSIEGIAVGRMLVTGTDLCRNRKSKAVHVLHVLNDVLCEFVAGTEASEATNSQLLPDNGEEVVLAGQGLDYDDVEPSESSDSEASDNLEQVAASAKSDPEPLPSLTPKEVDEILQTALLRAIQSVPRNAFPLSTSIFYDSHVLPSRPRSPRSSTPVDIKHSSFKSLGAFLKIAEKNGLVKLKGESVMTVNISHPDVEALETFATVGEAEVLAKQKEAEERARKNQVRELEIAELWQPCGPSILLFSDAGADTTALYSTAELCLMFSAYISARQPDDKHETQYLDIPEESPLRDALGIRAGKHCRREDAIHRLQKNMQAWHSIDGSFRLGTLEPITVEKWGKKGKHFHTSVKNFELFGLDADRLSDELQRICAGVANVAPLSGKNVGKRVIVHGKHTKAVIGFLVSSGIPSKWIKVDN